MSKINRKFQLLAMGVISTALAWTLSPAAIAQSLKVGAARIDITPVPADDLAFYQAVHDPIFTRALVVENSGQRAIIVIADIPMIEGNLYQQLVSDLSQKFDIAPEFLVVGVNHTHSAPRFGPTQHPAPEYTTEIDTADREGVNAAFAYRIPASDKFNAAIALSYEAAIKSALENLQPASTGVATGRADIVQQYANATEIFDTLGVQSFTNSDGEIIGVILNFGVSSVGAERDQISGDIPGIASRYLEARLNDDAVVLFMISMPQPTKYSISSDEAEMTLVKSALLKAHGVLIGEEAFQVTGRIANQSNDIRIAAAAGTLSCPGKVTYPRNLPRQCAQAEDGTPACSFKDLPITPVTLSYSVLRLGDVAYMMLDGNIVPALATKVFDVSPLRHSFLFSNNFGPIRHIVDEDAYVIRTYPATDTRAQPGCVEPGLIEGYRKLFEQTR